MQLRSDILLTSVIRSLKEAIAPALDTSDSLAQEQVWIVIGLLELLAKRLPMQFQFDCDELERLHALSLSLADKAHAMLPAQAAADFASAQTGAADVLERAKARPDEVLAAVRHLRAACAGATQSIYKASGEERSNLKDIILGYSSQQLVRDRAWLIDQGWERRPDDLPDIDDLIRLSPPRIMGQLNTD